MPFPQTDSNESPNIVVKVRYTYQYVICRIIDCFVMFNRVTSNNLYTMSMLAVMSKLAFHENHGSNVTLEDDSRTATRKK